MKVDLLCVMFVMGDPLVFRDAVVGDVPAAIVARGGLVVAGVAVEWAAVEELLQAGPVLGGQVARFLGQGEGAAAALALPLLQERCILIVHGPADDASAAA